MNVAHVTIEDICSGLFRTQVLDMARDVVRAHAGLHIHIYAINRPWKILEHLKQLRSLKLALEGSGVSVVYLPFLPPLRHALASAIYSRLVTGILFVVLKMFIPKHFDVFHARSYWPAMAMTQLGMSSVVFDPRSLWVLENISSGNLVENSDSHRYWLEAEEACVLKSSLVTVVSGGMGEYFDELYRRQNSKLVPISFSDSIFCYSEKGRAQFRELLRWHDDVVFIYSGSLGMSRINVAALQQLFGLVMSSSRAKLLFLTSEPAAIIESMMSGINVEISRYRIVRPKHEDMGYWLSAGDIGLHALPRQLDYKTRLGTKVVEYWACGLPVIVNDNVGAAAAYIRKEGGGKVVDETTSLDSFKCVVNEVLKMDRSAISRFASDNFSSHVIASLYSDAYNCASLSGRKKRG
jgi:glycosyltransferase involved in cell wall biosynthesis